MNERDMATLKHFVQGLVYGGLGAALPLAIQMLQAQPSALDWKVVASGFAVGALLAADKWLRDARRERAEPPPAPHG